MPLGRILPRPSATVPAQRAWPSLARLSLGRAARTAHGLAQLGGRERAQGAARVRYGGDLTGAREAAGESTAGPHRRVDGGAAELVGVDGG
jgi:hypothetical protein